MTSRTTLRPIILSAKIKAPSLPADLIFRPRLITKLNECAELPVTLIQAPAGYGKSCLTSLWVGRTSHHAGWITLEAEDASLDRFWMYVLAALTCDDIPLDDLISSAESLVEQETACHLIDRLIMTLDSFQKPTMLVLEDYHWLGKESPVHKTLAYFIAHVPDNVHIIITSRSYPQIGLSKLRVRGLLGEINEDNLRFTPLEIEDFFFKVNKPLSAEEAQQIVTDTDGWPVGIKLLSLAYNKEDSSFASFRDNRAKDLVYDYFFEEVIDQLPERIRTFLVITSCVDSFSLSLAEFLMSEETAEVHLSLLYLKENSLFVTETSGFNGELWYRYHTLFSGAVLERFTAGNANILQQVRKKACTWYVQRDFLDEAVKMASLVGDYEIIQKLIDTHWREDFYMKDRLAMLMRWYAYLPEEYITSRPILCIVEALPLAVTGNISQAVSRIALVDASLKSRNDEFYGLVMALKGLVFSLIERNEDAEHAAQEALAYLSSDEKYLMGMSYQILGGAQAVVAPEEAERLFLSTLSMSLTHQSENLLCSALSNLSVLTSILGSFDDTYRWAEEAFGDYDTSLHPLRPMLNYVYQAKAYAAYKQGDFEVASQCVEYALDHAYECWSAINVAHVYAVSAHIDFLASNSEEAARALKEAIKISPYGFARIYPALPALSTWISQGFLSESDFVSPPHMDSSDVIVWIHSAIHFVSGDRDDIGKLLAHYESIPERRSMALVHFGILIAAYYESLGDKSKAFEVLKDALSLAKDSKMKQPFIENAPYISDVLERVAKENPRSYAGDIYKQIPCQTHKRNPQTASELTDREKEIMTIAAEGLSTKEIAKRLFVSFETVKKHLSNIYIKLGVHTRMQAVAKLKENGVM